MAHVCEGIAYIPLEEFSGFVEGYIPKSDGELALGAPKVQDGDLVIPFAVNTECHPSEQSPKPDFLEEAGKGGDNLNTELLEALEYAAKMLGTDGEDPVIDAAIAKAKGQA